MQAKIGGDQLDNVSMKKKWIHLNRNGTIISKQIPLKAKPPAHWRLGKRPGDPNRVIQHRPGIRPIGMNVDDYFSMLIERHPDRIEVLKRIFGLADLGYLHKEERQVLTSLYQRAMKQSQRVDEKPSNLVRDPRGMH